MAMKKIAWAKIFGIVTALLGAGVTILTELTADKSV
jgi:hypothetical protein